MSNEQIPTRPKKLTLTEAVGRLLAVGALEVLRRQAEAGSAFCERPGGRKPPGKLSRKDREQ